MQINPKYTKNRPFLPALSQSSKVTPVKKWDALGINTNFCSNQAQQGLQPDELRYKENRRLAHNLRDRAGEILYTPPPLNSKKIEFRVCTCGKRKINKSEPVEVVYDPVSNRASYTNLQYCGSVWTCPVCAKKVSAKKKDFVANAVKAANKKGLRVAMLTLTIPHYQGDALKDLLDKLKKAKNYLFTNRNSREWFEEQFPIFGEITATEVKYSDRNGFHPHLHILLFLDREYLPEDIQRIEDEIYEFWAEKCVKRGLGKPSRKHGVDLKMEKTDGQTFASYIAKWGLASELTQSHMKVGKRNTHSLTMWEVLELSQMEASTKDKYSHIFKTYAKAFKGTRQIRPSNGLAKKLGMDELEDDEKLANEAEPESTPEPISAMFLSDLDLWLINKNKKNLVVRELIESDFLRDGLQSELPSVRKLLFDLKNARRFSRGQGEKFPCS